MAKSAEQTAQENAYREKLAAVHSDLFSQAMDDISTGIVKIGQALETAKLLHDSGEAYSGDATDHHKPLLGASALNTISEIWRSTRAMSESVHPNENARGDEGPFSVPREVFGGPQSGEQQPRVVSVSFGPGRLMQQEEQLHAGGDSEAVDPPQPRELDNESNQADLDPQASAIQASPVMRKLLEEGVLQDPAKETTFTDEAVEYLVNSCSKADPGSLELANHLVQAAISHATSLEHDELVKFLHFTGEAVKSLSDERL